MEWTQTDQKLSKEFKFSDFKSALDFVNKVAEIAEEKSHHPDIELSWSRVNIALTTHSGRKVTEKDYQLAAAIDKLKVT